MSNYPIKFNDKDKTELLLDNNFAYKEYLDYALKHNVDVIYTQTESTDSVRIIYEFIKNGFCVTLDEVPCIYEGIQLDPKIQARFER